MPFYIFSHKMRFSLWITATIRISSVICHVKQWQSFVMHRFNLGFVIRRIEIYNLMSHFLIMSNHIDLIRDTFFELQCPIDYILWIECQSIQNATKIKFSSCRIPIILKIMIDWQKWHFWNSITDHVQTYFFCAEFLIDIKHKARSEIFKHFACSYYFYYDSETRNRWKL